MKLYELPEEEKAWVLDKEQRDVNVFRILPQITNDNQKEIDPKKLAAFLYEMMKTNS